MGAVSVIELSPAEAAGQPDFVEFVIGHGVDVDFTRFEPETVFKAVTDTMPPVIVGTAICSRTAEVVEVAGLVSEPDMTVAVEATEGLEEAVKGYNEGTLDDIAVSYTHLRMCYMAMIS